MEARKRPWEDGSPIELQHKRRISTSAAAPFKRTPPLPLHAGHCSSSSDTLARRTLPPLYTPSTCTESPGFSPTASTNPLSAAVDATFRPRSQSLFDISLQAARQPSDGIQGHTQASVQVLERDRTSLAIGSDAHWPRIGTGPQPRAAGGPICCLSSCQGQACLNARALIRNLATELVLLDSRVRSLSQSDYSSPTSECPDFEDCTFAESLQWTFSLAQWTNIRLQERVHRSDPCSPDQASSKSQTPVAMRRGQQHLEQREEQSPPTRPYHGLSQGFTGYTRPGIAPEQSRSTPYGGEAPPNSDPSLQNQTTAGTNFLPPHSPLHTPQPSRPGMLPSPSSMNFPNMTNLPSISPSPSAMQSSAQTTHIQDLQHQISVKALALQTLQREYDSLLQKLERQRTKCATLEKKFEVSDVEINSLTDEKERLNAQVAMLEGQVEELQRSRDDTRKQLVANGAQYMRIMEMANRLQAQSAEDKRRWESEKAELRSRIKVLEEAMVTGGQQPSSQDQDTVIRTSLSSGEDQAAAQTSETSASSETLRVLRAEIGRLRMRTQSLESALRNMRGESLAIQEAARSLLESGGKIESAAYGAIGEGAT